MFYSIAKMTIVFITYILTSYNFWSSVILLIKTFTIVLSLSFPLAIGTMYYMGINGCNPYTSWYGVYHITNLYAFVVWLDTLVGFILSDNLDNAFVATWVLPALYTIVKSYLRNNNNHLVIILETYGLLTKYTNAIWST